MIIVSICNLDLGKKFLLKLKKNIIICIQPIFRYNGRVGVHVKTSFALKTVVGIINPFKRYFLKVFKYK